MTDDDPRVELGVRRRLREIATAAALAEAESADRLVWQWVAARAKGGDIEARIVLERSIAAHVNHARLMLGASEPASVGVEE